MRKTWAEIRILETFKISNFGQTYKILTKFYLPTNSYLEYLRTAPFKLINPKIKQLIVDELEKLKTSIHWNSKGVATNIQQAIEETRTGHDLGWEKTKSLMPRSDDHHHWMHFCHLLTILHNRDNSPKRFSIIRNAIKIF